MTDDRGLVPVLGKNLEAAIVVVFIIGLTAALFGGVVPTYRTTSGDAVAERVIASATQRVQQAVPPNRSSIRGRTQVTLPTRIRGQTYTITVDDRRLVLEHPRPGVGARGRPGVPRYVISLEGGWRSDKPASIVVEGTANGVTVRLVSGRQ